MGAGTQKYSVKEIGNLSLGQLGFDEISNSTVSPPMGQIFVALQVDTDATFSATSTIGDNLSSGSRVAGQIIYGSFSQVIVTDAGTVLGYRAPEVI